MRQAPKNACLIFICAHWLYPTEKDLREVTRADVTDFKNRFEYWLAGGFACFVV
jgi:hypothetical protein